MCQVSKLIVYVIWTKACLYSEMFGDVPEFKYCNKTITPQHVFLFMFSVLIYFKVAKIVCTLMLKQ